MAKENKNTTVITKETSLRGTKQSALNKEIALAKKPRNDEANKSSSLRGVARNKAKQSVSLTPKLRFKEFEGDWEKKKIRNISKFLDSKRIPLSQTERKTKKGKYPYYGASGIIDYIDNYIFDGEFILLGEDGANILMRNSPLAFLATGKFWVNNHAHVILANDNNKFLAESLERIKYDKYNTGTAQPKLNAEVCKNILINIPTLQEQQKIATFLTSVDDKIQQLTQKKTLLEQYKKGVMQQLFPSASSGQMPQIRFKPDSSTPNVIAKKTVIANASEAISNSKNTENAVKAQTSFPDWEEKRLGEISYITTGSSNRVDSSLDGEYTFFDRSEDIRTSSIYLFDAEAIIVPGEGQKFTPKYFIGKFDLHQRSYAIMNFKNTDGKFIFYHIGFHTNYLLSQAVGSTVKSLRLPMFKKMKINLPSLKEQQKIATYLSVIDKKITTIQTQIVKTQTFKKGLLQQMFV